MFEVEAHRPAGGGAVGHTEQVELVVPEGKNVQRDRCSTVYSATSANTA